MSLSIWIDCVWILLDVVFCVYVETELHPLTDTEWILAAAGVLFALSALVAEFLDREARAKADFQQRQDHSDEVAQLRRQIESGQSYQSGKLDTIAQLSGTVLERLGERAEKAGQRDLVDQTDDLKKQLSELKIRTGLVLRSSWLDPRVPEERKDITYKAKLWFLFRNESNQVIHVQRPDWQGIRIASPFGYFYEPEANRGMGDWTKGLPDASVALGYSSGYGSVWTRE